MKKYLFLLLLAISTIVPSYAKSQIAVYVVGDASDSYKKVIASALTQSVNNDGYFQAVERTGDFLQAMGNEVSYQNSGAVSQLRITELGKQFGAQYVFVVDLDNVLGELYASSRIINVLNNTVEAASDASSKVSNMEQLRTLAKQISTSTLSKLPYNVQKQQQANKEAFLQTQREFVNQFSQYRITNSSNLYNLYNSNKYSNLSKDTVLKYIQACKDLGVTVQYPIYYSTEIISRGTPYKVGKSGKYQSVKIKAYRMYETGQIQSNTWNVQVDVIDNFAMAVYSSEISGCFLYRQ